MDKETLSEGKERVRQHLIGPLTELQLQRPRKMTVAAHDAALQEVINRLAYMSAENLTALRELILYVADGRFRDTWPPVATILGLAVTIQKPDPSDSQMVRSFMASAAGRRALEGGYHVELYQSLKNGQVPRSEAAYRWIEECAEENRRAIGMARDRIARGVGTDDDADRVAWSQRVHDRVRALIVGQDAEVQA